MHLELQNTGWQTVQLTNYQDTLQFDSHTQQITYRAGLNFAAFWFISIRQHQTHTACSVLRILKPHLHWQQQQKRVKNTTPNWSSISSAHWKGLIQPDEHLDSLFIHLCIFSEGKLQSHPDITFQGRFVLLPLRKRKGRQRRKRSLRRETRVQRYPLRSVCMEVCFLLHKSICLLWKHSIVFKPSCTLHTDV